MPVDTKQLRGLLARTWYPFLGRFPQPTDIQREAIPAILAGEAVLLASPTATGKTEAYAAPLIERLLREKWASPAVVIVSPTRALANDLFRRLQAPLDALRVPLGRRTGDYAQWDEQKPDAVVVTTPESLDSLLARRPQALKTVRAVVLDELHVVHGTARGDQLAVLMTRLERLVMGVAAQAAAAGRAMPLPLQRIAATATAGGLERVAERYLGRRARLVHTLEQRQIEADLVPVRPDHEAEDIMTWLREARGKDAEGARKVLIFANSRAEVENLGAACSGKPPFGREVFVHHASLSQNERERVEKRFLDAPGALCFATMTLELGIDIGDIDRVGLVGPPPDVASLLQRVGRGNRRRWDTTRVACFYASAGQRARFEHLLACARTGLVGEASTVFRPSVLVQQAWSLAFQNRARWVDAKSLVERLPPWLESEYPRERMEELLAHLAQLGWLVGITGGRYAPGDRLERLFTRGQIHSNIASAVPDLEIVDETTERVVGYLQADPRAPAGTFEMPREVVLGGRKREVRRVTGKQVRVSSSAATGGAKFVGQGSPVVPLELAQSFARFIGLQERRPKVVRLKGRLLLAHFLGSAYGRLFTGCLKRSRRGLTAVGNAFVTVMASTEMPDLHFSETDVLGEISKKRRALSSALGDGPLGPKLPSGWWAAWLQEALDVPGFLTLVDTLLLDDEVTSEQREVLLSLAPRGSVAGPLDTAQAADEDDAADWG
jgi:ATP-dependent Lhr-like helicase